MELKITPIKYLRFDFDNTVSKETILIENQNIRYEYGKNEKGEWLGLRWTVNILNDKNQSEVIGFLSEKRAYFKKENTEKDIKDLKRFIENYFINIEMHFEDHLPNRLKNIKPRQPNYEKILFELIDFLSKN